MYNQLFDYCNVFQFALIYRLVRYHTANYFLPLTVKFLPESYKIMKTALQSVDEGVSQTRALHAVILLLQQARMNQITGEDWMVSKNTHNLIIVCDGYLVYKF